MRETGTLHPDGVRASRNQPDRSCPGGQFGRRTCRNTAATPLPPGAYSYRVDYTGDGWYERFGNRCVRFDVTARTSGCTTGDFLVVTAVLVASVRSQPKSAATLASAER